MLDDRFIPRYNGHCFADLPATIKFEMTKHGAHGGLTPDEVETPLLLFYF